MATKGQAFDLRAQFKTVDQSSLTLSDAADTPPSAVRPSRGRSRRNSRGAMMRPLVGGSVHDFATKAQKRSLGFDDDI